MWRLRPDVLRAAWWAWRSVRRVKRELPVSGVRTVVAPPPRLPASAAPGVLGVLSRLSPTCLERALVAQRWFASQGRRLDVIIGGRMDDEADRRTFAAHAWIEGSEPESDDAFEELWRIPAP